VPDVVDSTLLCVQCTN